MTEAVEESFEVVRNGRTHRIDPKKKVAICGFASSSLGQAPFGDESFEIWGLNSLYAYLPRWNRWYEIHARDHIKKDLNRAELKQLGLEHVAWLQSQPGPDAPYYRPIFMQDHYDDIPASVKWPRDEINKWTTAMFGLGAELDYFTSTPGEMVVHAIYEGYGEIHLYGIDLLQNEEYAYQRPGCEYWIGIARGMGIKVVVPGTSALCKASYVYGYSEPPVEFGAVAPLVDFHRHKVEVMKQEIQRVANEVSGLGSARNAFEFVTQKLPGIPVEDFLALVTDEKEKLRKRIELASVAIKKLEGAIEYGDSSATWTEHFGRGGKLENM